MELPHLGTHCTVSTCNKLDFLPIKCDACDNLFCEEHYQYAVHNCSNAYKKNNQVPVCPLCNAPVPVARGSLPDEAVGIHIDNDCQSDPAKNKRKVFTNRCSMKNCKTKEVVPILCNECSSNYCLKHRHPTDHNCEGKVAAYRNRNLQAALSRHNKLPTHSSSNGFVSSVQGNMSDDEALARALALSMQEAVKTNNQMTQEELDFALARQLQAEHSEVRPTAGSSSRNRCTLS